MTKALRHIAATAITATAITATAQSADSLALACAEHASPVAALRQAIYDNPAMQGVHHATSLNELYAGYNHYNANEPVRLEDGDRYNLGLGRIDAYLRGPKTTVWGAAEYQNGKYKNIQYCETSDYDIVAPYVMADTVGGDTQSERYYFMGGFCYSAGRFNIGTQGQYTAKLEYRTRDPRPKNLTGDLQARVGASYNVTNRQLLGVAVTARRYKQTNELELYNEVSVPTIYHLTGLGTDYYRFRGENTETYYKGYAVGANTTYSQTGLGPRPTADGWWAAAAYDFTHIDKIISDLNQLPMAQTALYSQTAAAGWSGRTPAGDAVGLALSQQWSKKHGTENIFGSAMDNIYPQISSAQQYSLTQWEAKLDAAWERTAGRKTVALSLTAAYNSRNESYLDPAREMKASWFTAGLSVDGRTTAGRVNLSANVAARYAWSITSSLTADDDALSSALFTPISHYYAYLSNDRWSLGAGVEAGYLTTGRVMPFIRVGLLRQQYAAGHRHCTSLEVAAGIKL